MKSANPATIAALERLLSDTYTLYLKTHSYHWNVTGPMFMTLHTLFETQYTDLASAVDEIAERIRSLGSQAPGSYTQFMEKASVREDPTVPSATDMIRVLLQDQQIVSDAARSLVRASEEAGDDASGDLGVRRLDVHEKNSWMLRSHLEG